MSLAVNSFEGLMTYDSEGNLQCAQAEKYEVSEDGLSYTFTLRDGLKWSNGEALTANDFAYAWKRAADVSNASGYAYLFDVFADGQYDADGNLIKDEAEAQTEAEETEEAVAAEVMAESDETLA
jgi:peptide/nickel transport system substrate-binding protein/oligopeptide transport system substrate-binding protein